MAASLKAGSRAGLGLLGCTYSQPACSRRCAAGIALLTGSCALGTGGQSSWGAVEHRWRALTSSLAKFVAGEEPWRRSWLQASCGRAALRATTAGEYLGGSGSQGSSWSSLRRPPAPHAAAHAASGAHAMPGRRPSARPHSAAVQGSRGGRWWRLAALAPIAGGTRCSCWSTLQSSRQPWLDPQEHLGPAGCLQCSAGARGAANGGRRAGGAACLPAASCSSCAVSLTACMLPALLFTPPCSGLWAIKKKNGGKFPTHAKTAAPAAAAPKKEAKFYAAGRVPPGLASISVLHAVAALLVLAAAARGCMLQEGCCAQERSRLERAAAAERLQRASAGQHWSACDGWLELLAVLVERGSASCETEQQAIASTERLAQLWSRRQHAAMRRCAPTRGLGSI